MCRGKTNDGSKAGRAGIATGANGSSNAVRGNVSDVGDIWGDFRRTNVEIGVLKWESASCNHVSLPRRDSLPFGDDLGPRGARVRGEDRGEVEGAYRRISTTADVKRLAQDVPSSLSLSRAMREGLLSLGPARQHKIEPGSRRVYTYRVARIRRVSAFALAGDSRDVYLNKVGIITAITVGRYEEVCAGRGILPGRVLPLVVDVGRG